jgi:hypothetical protein
MKKLFANLGIFLLILLQGCDMAEQFNEAPAVNFEAFWKLLD